MRNARTVVIVPVASVFLSVIQFLAVNGFGNGAEIPGDPPLTVQFLLSLLAQLVLREADKHHRRKSTLLSPARWAKGNSWRVDLEEIPDFFAGCSIVYRPDQHEPRKSNMRSRSIGGGNRVDPPS